MNPHGQTPTTFTLLIYDVLVVQDETLTVASTLFCIPYPTSGDPVVSIVEYRRMFADDQSPDALILKRLWFIENLCRSIIKNELNAHAQNKRQYSGYLF